MTRPNPPPIGADFELLEGDKAISVFLSRLWHREIAAYTICRYRLSKDNPLPFWLERGRVMADADKVRLWAGKQRVYRRGP